MACSVKRWIRNSEHSSHWLASCPGIHSHVQTSGSFRINFLEGSCYNICVFLYFPHITWMPPSPLLHLPIVLLASTQIISFICFLCHMLMTHTCLRKQLSVYLPSFHSWFSVFMCLKYQAFSSPMPPPPPGQVLCRKLCTSHFLESPFRAFQCSVCLRSDYVVTTDLYRNTAWHSLFPLPSGRQQILSCESYSKCRRFNFQMWMGLVGLKSAAKKGKGCDWHLPLQSQERTVKSSFQSSHSTLVWKKVPEPLKGSPSHSSSPRSIVGGVLWDCNSER